MSAATIDNVTCLDAELPNRSVMRTVTGNSLTAPGVPTILPPPSTESPLGSPVAANTYGGLPPVAANAEENVFPTVPTNVLG